MKKSIALLAGMTLLAASVANASKARLEALGQDNNGSLYIEDNRNILLNPAAVTQFGNFMLIEVGNDASLGNADDPATPDAQGGFVMEGSSLTYGVFLGHEDQNSRKALVDTGFSAPENTVEAFVGGQAGVNWGASLWYSAADGAGGTVDETVNTMGVRAGASTDMWQGFAHIALGTTAETAAGNEFEGTSAMTLGGSYNVGAGKVFAEYITGGFDITAGSTTTENTSSSYQIGWANTQEIEENAMFFYSVAYAAESEDLAGTETSSASLPITVGFEADANSWLAFRGSIKQPILINSADNGSDTVSGGDSTSVGAGASLKFDKLRIDGTAFSGGALNAADLLGRVAFTYNF